MGWALPERDRRKLFGFGALLAVLTFATWIILDIDRNSRLDAALLQHTNAISDKLVLDLETRTKAVHRMADRWRAQGREFNDTFTQDAENYLRDMPGFRALTALDEGFVARHVIPSANSRALGRNIADISQDRRIALETARDTGKTTLTNPVQLIDGSGIGFLMFTPISHNDEFLGILGTVFHVNLWLSSFFDHTIEAKPELPYLQITLNGTPIFVGEQFGKTGDAIVAAQPHLIFDQSLVVYNTQNPTFGAPRRDILPEVATAFVGVLSALILALIANGMRLGSARALSDQQSSALEVINQSLQSEVFERQNAEEKAKDADAAKSRFLAVMSHEVRTPLNAIMGMFELIERADVPERQKSQAKSGYRAANRLFEELSKVLDVSRLDAGAIQANAGAIESDVAFEDWSAQLTAMITNSGKDLTAKTLLMPDVPKTLWIDFDRTTQIVDNLINNAVKFTESGTITLAMQRNPRSDTLEISISDTGRGIAQDNLEQVFARFYQLEGGLHRSSQGSGLGLSICKDIAELMGGEITVISKLGVGSTFTLNLPTHHEPQGTFEAAHSSEKCAQQQTNRSVRDTKWHAKF